MKNIFSVNYNSKVFFVALATMLVLGSFFIADGVLASSTINSAKLNGQSNLFVDGSASITATVSVKLTDQSVWKSTAYRFGDGSWTCVDTPDHTGNNVAVETFSIITPAEVGTSEVYFLTYSNNNCTNSIFNMNVSPASMLTSVTNFLSLGTNSIWIINLLGLLSIIILVILYFFIRKR